MLFLFSDAALPLSFRQKLIYVQTPGKRLQSCLYAENILILYDIRHNRKETFTMEWHHLNIRTPDSFRIAGTDTPVRTLETGSEVRPRTQLFIEKRYCFLHRNAVLI